MELNAMQGVFHNTLPGDLNTNYIIFRNAENFKKYVFKEVFCEGKLKTF